MNETTPLTAKFLTSASQLRECPQDDEPEVAFAGRSNAGKSSTINCLTGTKQLARVSKTPGRTQLINFFSSSEGGRLVDLPGYGFARAAKRQQMDWGRAVDEYLHKRSNLAGLVLVMDSRHPLQPFDVQMIEWCEQQTMQMLVLLNKADKLKQRDRVMNLRKTEDFVGDSECIDLLLFSALRKTGSDQAREWIRATLLP